MPDQAIAAFKDCLGFSTPPHSTRIEQLQKLAEAKNSVRPHAELIQKLKEMQLTSQATTSAGLQFRRCQTIPHPQNPAFYGRNNVLQEIPAAFEQQTSRPASVAVWGTAGIGKTQIALEFAHRLWSSGQETILWIASETTAEVTRSFNDAARGLELEGHSTTNTPDQNRHLVLQWLQRTGKSHPDAPWLLVFDNVETHEAAIQNWPTVGHGKILVTCRSMFVAEADTIAKAIQVPAFTVPETTEMMHKIPKRSTLGNGGQLEEDATNRLSSKLGGLPLAIDIVAKQIKLSRRFKSVAQYLPYFEDNQESALMRPKRGGADPWYPRDLHNLWQPAFDDLNEGAAELMGILCFMGPGAIPTFLFRGKDWSKLRPRWEFLEDEERQVSIPARKKNSEASTPASALTLLLSRVDEATNILLESALSGINDETGIITVHRLIQVSYFLQMAVTSRLKSFHSALILLRTHFPSQESNGAHHFHTKWDLCGRLHQHVIAFRDRCQSPKNRATLPTNELTFIHLVRDNAWYMVETQQFLQAESAFLSILGDIDNGSLLATSIQRSLLGLYERTGRSVKACNAAEIEFKILEKQGVCKGNNQANANSNVGYALVSARRAAEGLKYLDTSVAMAKSHPEPERYQEYNIDRDFDEAEYFQDKMHGPHSHHYHGETKHERSKIAAWQGDLDSAARLSREAQALLSAGKPTHAGVMATLYRQGWIAMLQGDDDAALQHLEKALSICQLNEPHRGNAGESARVQWRMSQVYERKGLVEEAKRLRGTAEGVKRELLETGDYAVVQDDDEAQWDAQSLRRVALRAACAASKQVVPKATAAPLSQIALKATLTKQTSICRARFFSQTIRAQNEAESKEKPSEFVRNPNQGNDEPPNSIFVRNMVFDATEEHLTSAFSKFGEVLYSTIARDARGLSRGYGFVFFKEPEAVQAAIDGVDGSFWHGRRLGVTKRNKKERPASRLARGEASPTDSLFIGNIPYETTDAELNQLFRNLDNVTDIRVAVDRTTGWPRGFAHADFTDVESATKAKEKLAEIKLGERQLRVDFAAAAATRSRGRREEGGESENNEFSRE
ncbi:hypothetical protein OQA88_6802 [Cercophora sp. LCS_1]